MQQDFYTVEGLATQLLSSAFNNLNNIPDYRLRPMLRILPSLSQASLGGSEDINLNPALFSVWPRQRRVVEEVNKGIHLVWMRCEPRRAQAEKAVRGVRINTKDLCGSGGTVRSEYCLLRGKVAWIVRSLTLGCALLGDHVGFLLSRSGQ